MIKKFVFLPILAVILLVSNAFLAQALTIEFGSVGQAFEKSKTNSIKHMSEDRYTVKREMHSFNDVIDEGDFYWAGERKVPLLKSKRKFLVCFKQKLSFTSIQDMVRGYHTLETLTPKQFIKEKNFAVFQIKREKTLDDLKQVMSSLLQRTDVAFVTPVFVNKETLKEVMITDQFIVKIRPGVSLDQLEELNRENNVQIVRQFYKAEDQFLLRIENPKERNVLEVSDIYQRSELIEWAQPNFLFKLDFSYFPNDPLFSKQWHLRNTGQGGGVSDADVDADEAWDLDPPGHGGKSYITVAIIDTGIDIDHPDLKDNIYTNNSELNGKSGVDDDKNGFVDDIHGWDFWNWDKTGGDNDTNPDPNPDKPEYKVYGHGTCCAGIAAAVGDNDIGCAGVAYNSKILPVKISSAGGFSDSACIAQAIRYAANYADVLSCSWGGPGGNDAIHSAIQYAVKNGRGGKGTPVFCASGNSASGYRTRYLPIPPGKYFFQWEYRKDSSEKAGNDTVWLANITFPDGSVQRFDSPELPVGWSTYGDAKWSVVDDPAHAYGTGRYVAKAGTIGNSQLSGLQSPDITVSTTGNLTFSYWVSSEKGYDLLILWVCSNGRCKGYSDSGVPRIRTDVDYPAHYPECIAVGASTNFNYRADYSEYGPTLDIVAPSSGGTLRITTTDMVGKQGWDTGNYTTIFGGTSAACPLAAGIAALVLSKNPNLTAAQVQNILQVSAEKIGNIPYRDGRNDFYGYGKVNAHLALENTPPADTTPPTVTSTVPKDGASNIPISTDIKVTFSEAMDKASAKDAFSIDPDVAGSFSWDNNTLIFNPDSNLSYKTTYTVTISDSATDLAGNQLDGDNDGTAGGNYSFSFTTESIPDTTPPTVTSTVPKDGASNIPISTDIKVTFSEAMDKASAKDAFSIDPDVAGSFSWDNNTLIFNPDSNLSYKTTYTVTISDSATDLAGNQLDGDNDGTAGGNYSFSFTTAENATITLGEALDNTSLTWTTGGDADWFGQKSVYYYGGDAAQSGDITGGQSSWIETTVTGPGILSFYWKVSSSTAWTWLGFYIDGVEQSKCWTDEEWKLKTYSIPSGDHTLRWDYIPLLSGYAGFLDKVVFIPGPVIMVQSPNGGETWSDRNFYSIRWMSTEDVGPNVKIELYKGESLSHTISASTDNDGYYRWFVPISLTSGTDYRIKITSTSNSSIYDYSDAYFSIKEGFQSSFGRCFVLDGNDCAEAREQSELDVGNGASEGLTIEAWVNIDFRDSSSSEERHIIRKPDSYDLFAQRYSEFDGVSMTWKTYGCLGYTLWLPSGKPTTRIRGYWPPYSRGWHHVALVFSKETGEVRLYLDGKAFSDPYYVGPVINNSTKNLKVGENFKGAVDEVRISDVARYTGSTYDVPTSPFTCDQHKHTRALWHFDEPEGATRFHDACGVDNCLYRKGPPPGDCNADGKVRIDEIQKAINCFLGIQNSCCDKCDLNSDGTVSIAEVQKVINAYLGEVIWSLVTGH